MPSLYGLSVLYIYYTFCSFVGDKHQVRLVGFGIIQIHIERGEERFPLSEALKLKQLLKQNNIDLLVQDRRSRRFHELSAN